MDGVGRGGVLEWVGSLAVLDITRSGRSSGVVGGELVGELVYTMLCISVHHQHTTCYVLHHVREDHSSIERYTT